MIYFTMRSHIAKGAVSSLLISGSYTTRFAPLKNKLYFSFNARDSTVKGSELSEAVVTICRTVHRFLASYEEGREADKPDL